MGPDETTVGMLVLTPTLRGRFLEDGRVRVTRKFVEGMRLYAEMWPGRVVALVRHSEVPDKNLDPEVVDPAELPFGIERADFADEREMAGKLVDAAVVMASLDCDQTGMAGLCRRLGVPCVYSSEYSLRTRREIIRATVRNPLARWRKNLWTTRLEKRQVAAVSAAGGIQCNGTPTYEAYKDVAASPFLYFDTRVSGEMVVGRPALEERLGGMMRGGPLRLAFSGRLARMKGADDLAEVARLLVRRGVEFEWSIFGDGECRQEIAGELERLGLGGRVRLCGVVDFGSELMPTLAASVDLMVLPHPQGDPACTYLETLAAGVPIAGYANEAWEGVLRTAQGTSQGCVGVAAKLGSPAALAEAIARLEGGREELAVMSRNAVAFASEHTFEATFARRVAHLRSLARVPRGDSTLAEARVLA